jgi:hypothetical protein
MRISPWGPSSRQRTASSCSCWSACWRSAFAFVASNVAVNHEPKPHNLPVGVIGSPQVAHAVDDQLKRSAPGGFEIRTYSSRAAARTAVLRREIYGAFEPGPPASLLVASAASPAAEQVLQQTFQAVAVGQGQALGRRRSGESMPTPLQRDGIYAGW